MYEDTFLASVPPTATSWGFVSWLVPAISSMVGVLVGAGFTYLLQRRLVRDQQLEANHHAAIENQFLLVCQLNIAVVLSRYLDKFKNEPMRHAMLNRLAITSDRPQLRTDGLTFLLRTNHADVVAKLAVCDQKFKRLLVSIDERNDLKDGRVLDYVSSKVDAGMKPDEDDWRIVRLKTLTDEVYDAASDYLEYNADCSREFGEALKAEYPDEKFLRFEITEQAQ